MPNFNTGLQHPDIKFDVTEKDGNVSKVVAWLSNYLSGRYTKLGRNLLRIEKLEKEVKELKESVKEDTRELVADLFGADALLATRVVETVGFTFEMSKNPKVTESYKYAEILKALEKDFTPSLIARYEELKEQFKTETQKSPSLKAKDKNPRDDDDYIVREGMFDSAKKIGSKFLSFLGKWAEVYDHKFDKLKAMLPLTESATFFEATDGDYANFKNIVESSALRLIERNAEDYLEQEGNSFEKTMERILKTAITTATYSFEEEKRQTLRSRGLEDQDLWEFVEKELDAALV